MVCEFPHDLKHPTFSERGRGCDGQGWKEASPFRVGGCGAEVVPWNEERGECSRTNLGLGRKKIGVVLRIRNRVENSEARTGRLHENRHPVQSTTPYARKVGALQRHGEENLDLSDVSAWL